MVTVVGKSWDFHVSRFSTTMEENLAMIGDTVSYRKRKAVDFFDAEHFFDGYRATRPLDTIRIAAENGADTVVLWILNGGTMPRISENYPGKELTLGITPILIVNGAMGPCPKVFKEPEH